MNPERTNKQIHEQRAVIVLQLGILVAILIGIFSTVFVPTQSDQIPEVVDLQSVPLIDTASDITSTLAAVTVRAESAYVWDVNNQRFLYSKNADEVLPLASIAKLMTTLLAHELVTDDTTARISPAALQQEGSSGFVDGEIFTTEQLRELSLISSSNDAAFALAANVGQLLGESDPMSQFIAAMNIRATELGLDSLEFKNTTGLDISVSEPSAVGSAKDVSLLLAYMLENYPEIVDPTRQVSTRVYNNSGAFHDISNTNEAVNAIPNLLASKTGFTDLAGGNLTIAFDAGLNRPIIITVLGSTRNERFTDTLRLTKAIQENI